MNRVAYNYYLNIKDFYENRYLHTNISNKLFTIQDKYDFFVPYYMILIADKVQDFECVVKMYEIVFTKKQRMFDEWYVKNLLFNLQFFLQHVPKHNTQFVVLANEYIKFVYDNGVRLHTFDFWLKPEYKNAGLELDNYIITEVTNKKQKFSKDECASSKNILIYTGFSDIEWNYTYIQNNALGGSEKAVSYISQCFSQCFSQSFSQSFSQDYTIYISGHVKNETIGNIQYINLNELTKLMEITPFHTVIVSRYISFYEMFKECSFYQSFIWAHDVLLLPYGSSLNDTQILEKWDKYINGCICLTEWHKNEFIDRYPILKDKITLINNGLDLKSFSINNNNNNNNTESKYTNKIKNKFIYSSRPDRGLNVLLQLWPKILEIFPDAVLVVSSYGNFPSNSDEIILKNIIDSNDSIKFLGKLSTDQLYVEMASSEYWLYPTHWPETSCITALEMLMSEVICLYYPVAGLVNTMDIYGIPVQSGKEIDTLVSLTDVKKETLRKNGREYAETCSWSNRCEKWNKLLSLNQIINPNSSYMYENNFIKIVNLERRKDRLDVITNNLKRLNIDHYEIIKAVDGKILKPTTYIKNLFKGNDFNYRKCVIGCALSHYNLWKRLLNDNNNNYYCIFEDDIIFVDNFKEKLEKVLSIFNGDFCLLGGGTINVPNINISELNIIERSEKIVDGTYAYIITKNGAKQMIEYIEKNKIKRAIDTIYSATFNSISVVNQYLAFTPSFQLNGNTDTDIQLDFDSLTIPMCIK
jgi:GR25 family glycosyltransferase involved in LPS biosynthesis/glycosyltransferase involved in cell wall biosynthesis